FQFNLKNQGSFDYMKEVIDLLLKAPPQRLCSLTFQLGPTIEEDIVHALCLFIQQRVLQALEKLQAHSKNVLAKHLLEKWQRNTRNIEEYKVHCGDFQESESLVTLARVFKVLTQHGLCDRDLLYLAYKRAFPCESSDSNVLEYNHFIEEAKQVCGPEIVELLGTFTNFKLVNVPSPLQSTSSVPSFPSHLEISLPSTDVLATPGSSITRSQSDPSIKPSFNLHGQRLEFKFPNQPTEPTSKPSPEESFEAAPQEEPEQEEVKFYSFVILHAQQDDIIKGDGATFSNEFEVPGKYTISCIEDAINNSAFTFLLLTTNFNSFLEMKTNSALINSIQNPAKRDTVIPLLPQSNAMPKEEFPMVLKTLISLMESNKHFEKKIQQVLNPKRIKCQREEWMKEQKVKMLKERQEKLKISNQQQVRENEEYRNMIMLEQQRLSLFNERYSVPEQRVGPDGRPWSQQQQPPQINITNARYIIIGDNSQMAVELTTEAEHKEDT
uniref:TIR domain-containing protein n=1 Tax=Neogobius melanostomus TaxID=47308 RepID=A0A8C6TTI6_9GOBI